MIEFLYQQEMRLGHQSLVMDQGLETSELVMYLINKQLKTKKEHQTFCFCSVKSQVYEKIDTEKNS